MFLFSTYIFSADISPEMLKLCRVTKVKVFFIELVYILFSANFKLFEFLAAILKKGLLRWLNRVMQDHEARASDLNRKVNILVRFAVFLIKATET